MRFIIKIAIVVLNWNGIKWLKKFLPILIKYSKEANIYMIDNNSTDKSVEFVKNNMQSVNIIKHTENKGYAQGYNDALKKINSTYYILINSDIEVTNNWLSSIIELMDKNPNIGASQPKILDINNRKMFEYAGASGGFIDILGYPFCRGRIFDTIEEVKSRYTLLTGKDLGPRFNGGTNGYSESKMNSFGNTVVNDFKFS